LGLVFAFSHSCPMFVQTDFLSLVPSTSLLAARRALLPLVRSAKYSAPFFRRMCPVSPMLHCPGMSFSPSFRFRHGTPFKRRVLAYNGRVFLAAFVLTLCPFCCDVAARDIRIFQHRMPNETFGRLADVVYATETLTHCFRTKPLNLRHRIRPPCVGAPRIFHSSAEHVDAQSQ